MLIRWSTKSFSQKNNLDKRFIKKKILQTFRFYRVGSLLPSLLHAIKAKYIKETKCYIQKIPYMFWIILNLFSGYGYITRILCTYKYILYSLLIHFVTKNKQEKKNVNTLLRDEFILLQSQTKRSNSWYLPALSGKHCFLLYNSKSLSYSLTVIPILEHDSWRKEEEGSLQYVFKKYVGKQAFFNYSLMV